MRRANYHVICFGCGEWVAVITGVTCNVFSWCSDCSGEAKSISEANAQRLAARFEPKEQNEHKILPEDSRRRQAEETDDERTTDRIPVIPINELLPKDGFYEMVNDLLGMASKT